MILSLMVRTIAVRASRLVVRPRRRTDGAGEPQRTPQAAVLRTRLRQRLPLAEELHRLRGVHLDVAVPVARARLLDGDLLVPAVHARDRVGLHGERQVLVDAAVL